VAHVKAVVNATLWIIQAAFDLCLLIAVACLVLARRW
jgi:hypothetical protein